MYCMFLLAFLCLLHHDVKNPYVKSQVVKSLAFIFCQLSDGQLLPFV